MNLQDIELKLETLREKWKNKQGNPEILKLQARALENARKIILQKDIGKQVDMF